MQLMRICYLDPSSLSTSVVCLNHVVGKEVPYLLLCIDIPAKLVYKLKYARMCPYICKVVLKTFPALWCCWLLEPSLRNTGV